MNIQISDKLLINLLVEKKFKIEFQHYFTSFNRYEDALEFCKIFPNKFSEDSYTINEDIEDNNKVYNCNVELSTFKRVPTIMEVVMWLYEKHGIWVIVDCDCYGESWFCKISIASEKNWNDLELRDKINKTNRNIPNEHKSPIQAYVTAMEHILQNLIP